MISPWKISTVNRWRSDMADRGIEVVRAHLAKLPPADSLTIAERRAQYERAEKVFPIPPEVKVERVTAPVAAAEWLRPPPSTTRWPATAGCSSRASRPGAS